MCNDKKILLILIYQIDGGLWRKDTMAAAGIKWDNIPHIRKGKLFFFLPLFSIKQTVKEKVWKIFGIPFFKICRRRNGARIIYSVLGIPVLKIAIKQEKTTQCPL